MGLNWTLHFIHNRWRWGKKSILWASQFARAVWSKSIIFFGGGQKLPEQLKVYVNARNRITPAWLAHTSSSLTITPDSECECQNVFGCEVKFMTPDVAQPLNIRKSILQTFAGFLLHHLPKPCSALVSSPEFCSFRATHSNIPKMIGSWILRAFLL